MNEPKSKRHKNPFKIKPIFFAAGLFLLVLTLFIALRIHSSDRRLIPLSVFALLAGLFYEARRLYEKWTTFLGVAFFSFVFSFLGFLPGKHEDIYILEDHIQMWPYVFIFLFVIITISFNEAKTISHVTEGITLLQSIAVVYWVIDLHLYEISSMFVKIFMGIGLLFSAFTLFNAFTPFILSRTKRLILSIWSCIIMVLFAADNIYRTYQNNQIEATSNLPDALFIGLQFFLLGISSIYITQNLFMLFGFLPARDTFFNAKYFKEIRELKNEHIKRYSVEQVSVIHSILCIAITGTIFYANYYFQILPRNLAILSVFVVFPYVLYIIEFMTKQFRSE